MRAALEVLTPRFRGLLDRLRNGDDEAEAPDSLPMHQASSPEDRRAAIDKALDISTARYQGMLDRFAGYKGESEQK